MRGDGERHVAPTATHPTDTPSPHGRPSAMPVGRSAQHAHPPPARPRAATATAIARPRAAPAPTTAHLAPTRTAHLATARTRRPPRSAHARPPPAPPTPSRGDPPRGTLRPPGHEYTGREPTPPGVGGYAVEVRPAVLTHGRVGHTEP